MISYHCSTRVQLSKNAQRRRRYDGGNKYAKVFFSWKMRWWLCFYRGLYPGRTMVTYDTGTFYYQWKSKLCPVPFMFTLKAAVSYWRNQQSIKLLEREGYELNNEGKSSTSFCHQVAACFPDMFCNFYLVKNPKIAKNSTTTKAREKNKHRFGILRILEFFWCTFD